MSAVFGNAIFSDAVFANPTSGDQPIITRWRERCEAESDWRLDASESEWADVEPESNTWQKVGVTGANWGEVSNPTTRWVKIQSDPQSIKRC